MKLFDIMIKTPSNSKEPLVKSKGEARRMILNKGVRLNDFTVIDSNADIFLHGSVWLLVEKNRLTAIDTAAGTVKSVDITDEQYKTYMNKDG